MKDRYRIEYVPAIKAQLASIDRKHWSMIRRALERSLRFEPAVPARNRKPLLRGEIVEATWELRFGPRNRFRAFYNVDEDHKRVEILAIGIKRGNRLWIGGRELGG